MKRVISAVGLIAVSATVGLGQQESLTRGQALYRAGKHEEAAVAFKEACDGGSAAGCGSLGVLYLNGTGVTKDETKASALLQKACEGGNALGCRKVPLTTTTQLQNASFCVASYGVAASAHRSARSLAAAAARQELIGRVASHLKGDKDAVATFVAAADKSAVAPPGKQINWDGMVVRCDGLFGLEVAKTDDGEINAEGNRVFQNNTGSRPTPSAPGATPSPARPDACSQIETRLARILSAWDDEVVRANEEMREPMTDGVRNAKISVLQRSWDYAHGKIQEATKAAKEGGCSDFSARLLGLKWPSRPTL